MTAVPALDAAAQLDQIFVGIDDASLDRLGRLGIVATVVHRHPAPAKLVASLNLRPCHTGSHAVNLFRARPLPHIIPRSSGSRKGCCTAATTERKQRF